MASLTEKQLLILNEVNTILTLFSLQFLYLPPHATYELRPKILPKERRY